MAVTDTINIDFQIIPTGNPKTLAVMDTSVWGILENRPSIIEIIPPNKEEPVTHYFEKSKVSIFNSSNLLLSSIGLYVDMPDGLYTITVKGSPDTNCKKRYFLKDDKTKLELYKLYASLGVDNDEKTIRLKKDIQKAEMLIRGANALIALGKIKRAVLTLKRAMEFLQNYNRCSDCK